MDVVIRDDLCEKEKNYIQKRLQTVKHWASNHGIPCKDNELPHVALLGSGGGQRAQIAFLGVLRQLAEDNLLDSILYLAGVSGSTWTMASLYDEADWSGNVVDELVKKALTNMSENQSSSFHDCLQWLKNRDHEGNLSLTDYWGVVTCFIKGVKLETRTLADEGQRDKGGATPYPLYSAVDKDLLHEKEKKELWFEMSPYESGFTEPGAFVETSLLKQPFKGGKVQMDSRRKPMDMVQLQGICGSAFGDGKTNIKFIIAVIKDWFRKFLHRHGVYNDIVEAALQLFEHYDDMELSYDTLAGLSSTLRGKVDCFDVQSETLMTLDREGWKAMTDEQKQQHIQRILEEIIQSLPENPPERLNLMSWSDFKDGLHYLKKAIALVYHWNFGEMPNILYNLQDSRVPQNMCEEDIMHVIDAGLYLNSPYPPMLGKKRGIDLIISFDFSSGDPFETVDVASRYAKTCKVPFPKINLEGTDDDCPKSLHIFEEKGKPTVIHIPLFNVDNCKDREGVKRERKEYATFQRPYRGMEKINHLADLAGQNVKVNKEAILKEIRKVARN